MAKKKAKRRLKRKLIRKSKRKLKRKLKRKKNKSFFTVSKRGNIKTTWGSVKSHVVFFCALRENLC